MNDRFRFRAWDKTNNIMINEIGDGWFRLNFKNVCESDEFILEQCTGLKDKNGKLIYEGDIVKVTQLSTNLPVVYYQKFAMFELISNKYLVGLHGSDENLEVIGNIHENPELLEAK